MIKDYILHDEADENKNLDKYLTLKADFDNQEIVSFKFGSLSQERADGIPAHSVEFREHVGEVTYNG